MATLMQNLTNPLDMLMSDHEYVKGVFNKLLATDSLMTQRVLFRELADNLTVHARLEEELFYPALERHGGEDGRHFVEEAHREHEGIKHRLKELHHTGVEETKFRMRVETLKEAVVRHAEREEGIFPLTEDRLPLRKLAQQMDLRRMQLTARVRPPSALALMSLILIGIGLFAFVSRRR